jgi:hypothetical protein
MTRNAKHKTVQAYEILIKYKKNLEDIRGSTNVGIALNASKLVQSLIDHIQIPNFPQIERNLCWTASGEVRNHIENCKDRPRRSDRA